MLADADESTVPADRYVAAHNAAAIAALVAVRATPMRRRGRRARPLSVWALLEIARPELRDLAVYCAAASKLAAAARAGVTRLVSGSDADEYLCKVRELIAAVEPKEEHADNDNRS